MDQDTVRVAVVIDFDHSEHRHAAGMEPNLITDIEPHLSSLVGGPDRLIAPTDMLGTGLSPRRGGPGSQAAWPYRCASCAMTSATALETITCTSASGTISGSPL